MKSFLKVGVACGILLGSCANFTLQSMENFDRAKFFVEIKNAKTAKDNICKKLARLGREWRNEQDERLIDFVSFGLTKLGEISRLTSESNPTLNYFYELTKRVAYFDVTRTKILRRYKKLFNLKDMFEALDGECPINIVDIPASLRKVNHYLDQIISLDESDRECWNNLFALDEGEGPLSFAFDLYNDDLEQSLTNLCEEVSFFEDSLNSEQTKSSVLCDEDFDQGAKCDRRKEHTKRTEMRKLRRAKRSR